jgi:hypothetical protein
MNATHWSDIVVLILFFGIIIAMLFWGLSELGAFQ